MKTALLTVRLSVGVAWPAQPKHTCRAHTWNNMVLIMWLMHVSIRHELRAHICPSFQIKMRLASVGVEEERTCHPPSPEWATAWAKPANPPKAREKRRIHFYNPPATAVCHKHLSSQSCCMHSSVIPNIIPLISNAKQAIREGWLCEITAPVKPWGPIVQQDRRNRTMCRCLQPARTITCIILGSGVFGSDVIQM